MFYGRSEHICSLSHPQHAGSWLQVIHSLALGLNLASREAPFALRWLGLQLCEPGTVCALCPDKTLNLHHAALSSKKGSDVIAQHNQLRGYCTPELKEGFVQPGRQAGRQWTRSSVNDNRYVQQGCQWGASCFSFFSILFT